MQDPTTMTDTEIFDESGFWYAADFEDLKPFQLFRLKHPSSGELHEWSNGSEFLCLSYPADYEGTRGLR